MSDFMRFWGLAALLGIGATAVMDLGALVLGRAGITPPDYGMVGRWVAHMRHGRFRHEAIARAPAMPGERALGWLVHYGVGVAYAALLLAIVGSDWLRAPTVGVALAVGLGTVAAPFLLMQPAMGAGIAASRAPNPAAARARSLLNHALFGLGLYAAGWAMSVLLAG